MDKEYHQSYYQRNKEKARKRQKQRAKEIVEQCKYNCFSCPFDDCINNLPPADCEIDVIETVGRW